MSLVVDTQFVANISHLLRNFKKKADYLWNFSCPTCGDSKRHPWKARGFIYRHNDGLRYKCHKCEFACSFYDLIAQLDEGLWQKYKDARYRDKLSPSSPVVAQPRFYDPPAAQPILGHLPSIRSLALNHPARLYIESRQIPTTFHRELFWADDFSSLVTKLRPEHYEGFPVEGRVVIPLLDSKGMLLGVQGRSIEPHSTVKYVNAMTFDGAPLIYGQHNLDDDAQNIYVVEGAFDSMFLGSNCLAMCGGNPHSSIPQGKAIICYDNEPWKITTTKKLGKAIQKGYRVCVWPTDVREKDINAMVLAGRTPASIKIMLDASVCSGPEAMTALMHWRTEASPTPSAATLPEPF